MAETTELKKSDFYFDLPQELIAQDPLEVRHRRWYFLEIWRNWELSWMKNMVLEVKRHFMPGKGISHCPWYIRSARIPIRGKRKYSSSCRTIVKFFIF